MKYFSYLYPDRILLYAVFFLAASPSVLAGSEVLTLINMLHENGMVNKQQYARLMDEIRTGKAQREDQKQALQKQLDDATAVNVSVNKGGLQVKSKDGAFSAKIGGRLQADGAWHHEDVSALGDGSKIRRARLYLKGTLFHDWFYKFEYDFAGSGGTNKGITDIWLGYSGFDHLSIKFGHFRDPFMLQDQVSDNNTQFTERALPDAFTAGRHIGIMASSNHKHWTAAAGFFGDKASVAGGSDDEGWGTGGRLTWMPFNEKRHLLHLGLAANYRQPEGQSVRFKQQAETHISGVNFVDTGAINNVENYLALGAEFAAQYQSVYAQAEYIHTYVHRQHDSDLMFDGWYVQTGWFITGESRPYTHKGAKFKAVKPDNIVGQGGWGAWELGFRYSTINLNDHAINGGELDNITFGLNWFPAPGLRMSANYVRVLASTGGSRADDEPGIVQFRGQWAF